VKTVVGPPWAHTQAGYKAGRTALDSIEAKERALHLAWGVGRARLCLAPDVRERYDAQEERLWRASREADLPTLLMEVGRMEKALAAADKAAQACGVLLPGVWEARMSDGSTLAIVQEREHAARVRARDRALEVWTVEELATLVEAQDAPLRALKRRFGAILTSMQATPLADPDAPSSEPFKDDSPADIRW